MSYVCDEYKQNPISADDRVDFSMSNNAKLFPPSFFFCFCFFAFALLRLTVVHKSTGTDTFTMLSSFTGTPLPNNPKRGRTSKKKNYI